MARKRPSPQSSQRKKITVNVPGPEPRVFTEDDLKLVEHLAACITLGQIADYFKISEKTFHNIKNRQPEVEMAYRRGRANVTNDIGRSLIQRARSGDVKAQQFFLRTQGGWREGLDLTSSDGSMTPTTITRVIVDPKT